MKTLSLILVAAALAVSGCKTTPSPAPGIDAAKVSAPSDQVPKGVAAFVGVWSGKWGNVLEGKLGVLSVTPQGSADVEYSWAEKPGSFQAGKTTTSGQIKGDTLTLAPFSSGA